MSTVLIILMLAALVISGPILYFIFKAAARVSGPRYQGEAPHQGPVMRFTGTSSEVKEDSGKQTTTRM
jgi:hypothetical protein